MHFGSRAVNRFTNHVASDILRHSNHRFVPSVIILQQRALCLRYRTINCSHYTRQFLNDRLVLSFDFRRLGSDHLCSRIFRYRYCIGFRFGSR